MYLYLANLVLGAAKTAAYHAAVGAAKSALEGPGRAAGRYIEQKAMAATVRRKVDRNRRNS